MPNEIDSMLLRHADWIRVVFFVFFIFFLSWWQISKPKFSWPNELKIRWKNHLCLTVVSKLLIKAVFGVTAVYVAWLVKEDKVGVFNQYSVPANTHIILGVIFLDFVIYVQHRLMHKWKWLWRLHQVHHLDNRLDVSTGIRFHPLEELISFGVKLMAIIFMGVPIIAVFIFEILLSFSALFTHANIDISSKADKKLRYFIVTPEMHRVHHTIEEDEQNSNFGFFLSIWDRIFNSYREYTRLMNHKIVFGLFEERRLDLINSYIYLLLHPFGLKRYKQRKKKLSKLKIRSCE
jgi:sterol desaturase/sphingolipid hydroxylase (fatty acid hydroxylase superfamily)